MGVGLSGSLDVLIRRRQLERRFPFDGGDAGKPLGAGQTIRRKRPGDHADFAEYLIDPHSGQAQSLGELIDLRQLIVTDGHHDQLWTRRHCDAWASPAPTSIEDSGSRRAVRVSTDHSAAPVAPVRCAHSEAMPDTCGVAMLVPLMVW